ncbi:MAG: hypothetical protein WC992_00235 [Acholeplasmataceae bacterium]|jgi:hypothetical protein
MKEHASSTLSPAEIKVANAQMRDWMSDESGPEGAYKVAAATTDVIRTRVREGSISRNILEPRQIGSEELVPSLEDDDPRYIGEIEADTPGGMVATLGQRPKSWYFHGRRYEARFSRLMTRRFQKDTAQLLTYKSDLRQMVSDNSLKDLLGLEDLRFFQLINTMLAPTTGAAGEILPQTQTIQWDTINDSINPDSVADSLTIMNRSNFGLDPATAVVNLATSKQFLKWSHTDLGDLVSEVKQKGWGEREWMGVRWLVTIKNWLVPDGSVYYFAPGNFIGETLVLTDATMHVKKDAFMVEFWAYQLVAQVIAHFAGVARCDFLLAKWGGEGSEV